MKKYEQLEKIQNLKEKGVLSESEFEEEKEKLLNAETFDVKGKTGSVTKVGEEFK